MRGGGALASLLPVDWERMWNGCDSGGGLRLEGQRVKVKMVVARSKAHKAVPGPGPGVLAYRGRRVVADAARVGGDTGAANLEAPVKAGGALSNRQSSRLAWPPVWGRTHRDGVCFLGGGGAAKRRTGERQASHAACMSQSPPQPAGPHSKMQHLWRSAYTSSTGCAPRCQVLLHGCSRHIPWGQPAASSA